MIKPKQARRHPPYRKGRFFVPTLDVVHASASAKKRAGAHVVGRPFTNYLLEPSAAVDAIADRLPDVGGMTKQGVRIKLRKAVLTAHEAGSRKIMEFNALDHATQATAAMRALRELSKVVTEPFFLGAIQLAVPIAEAKNPTFGDRARDLVRGLEHVMLLEMLATDAQRGFKPVKRRNPGKPYMAGLAESLAVFWHNLTGELPSVTRVTAKRSRSRRVLFWDFADRALIDLSLRDHPIDYHLRMAINRLKRVRHPR